MKEELKEKHPEIYNYIEWISEQEDIDCCLDDFDITELADGIIKISSSKWEKSKCYVKKNDFIEAESGSRKDDGQQNEFLNYLLPNKTYVIDGYTKYITDSLRRVVLVISDRNKETMIEHGDPYDKTCNRVREEGKEGDEAGHLISRATGGANEKINLVPMSKMINKEDKNGIWWNLEQLELAALKLGKNVISIRQLLYKENSKRPYTIISTTIIDGYPLLFYKVPNPSIDTDNESYS